MAEATHELRFALLGDEPPARTWYTAIQGSDRHRIVATFASHVAGVGAVDHWQALAGDPQLDAGLLLVPNSEALEGARQLAMRGKGVVIDGTCPLPASLVAELGLLDVEGAAAVIPFFEWRAFPVQDRLRQLVAEGQLGQLVQIRIERTFPVGLASSPDRVLCDEVTEPYLFSDLDLLRWIGGDYSQVTLLRTGATELGFAGQTLNLAGAGLPDATCVYRAGVELSWTCEVQGTQQTATIRSHGEGFALTVDGNPVMTQDSRSPDSGLCLRLIDDALSRRPGSLCWRDRVRIHEVQEAMQRSLRRRRTIDLHFETASERSQFKTHMATAGCFVLVYTFLASVFLLLAGAVLDPRDQVQRQAEAARFIVPNDEFVTAADQLTTAGLQRLRDMADRWESTGAVVVIEEVPTGGNDGANAAARNRARLEAVRRHLHEWGVQRVDERTVVRTIAGQGFQRLMMIGRVVAFAPLSLLLLMQLLLLAARPAREPSQQPAMKSRE